MKKWSLGTNKSINEQFYSDIANKYQNREVYKNSFNGKIAKLTAEGLEYASGVVAPIGNALHLIPKVGAFAASRPILIEKTTNGVLSIGATYASNSYNGKETDYTDLAWSGGTGFITGGMSVPKTIGVNAISSGIQANQKGEDPYYAAGATAIATTAGVVIGKGIEVGGYRLSVGNVARNKGYYEPQYRTKEAMGLLNERYKFLPQKAGNIVDSLSSEFLNNHFNNKYENEGK